MSDQTQSEQKIRVRMAEVDSICVYQVTEDELETLEKGSPGSLYLNFALFFISTALSFFLALMFATVSSDRVFYTFVIVIVLGMIAGVVLFTLWFKENRSSVSVARRIRKRLREETAQTIKTPDSIFPLEK